MQSENAIFRMLTKVVPIRNRRSRKRSISSLLRRDQRGVSALEFSLFAPILIFGFLSVADLAFLAQQDMAIGHVLRIGADEAMMDLSPDPEASYIVNVMNRMATENFAVDSTSAVNGKPPVKFSAARSCACPNNINAPQSCSSICTTSTGNTTPLAFYTLSAESRSLNVFLPQITLKPSIKIQVR
ncbi:TadE/TadG family type IV pilus assembly protein [Microvirga solisilvae]|uniref:TadE/TadG family type IV pilus assembly protein n=1 Tax=Microvirga solisilvae TaxID=2919498 RepID=UPI001FAF2F75|nr:TadE family protein [Microvirga solisilvae]